MGDQLSIDDFRAWHTVVLMVAFIGIVVWAYSKKRKRSFDDAANLPFADQAQDEATIKKDTENKT
jgi:cytochrome c oxidase cbb3-type subunit 4